MELSEALRSPNPFEYKSRVPIHQDGTCNGLQHYAALGGDTAGAQQVNLIPSETPFDVYSGIADTVRELVEKDVELQHPLALMMKGKITRKLVKQTVMTNTYGVTFLGAIAQVTARMEDTQKDDGFTDAEIRQCAKYITTQIFKSFGKLFTGAQAIQMWLSTSARIISKSISQSELDLQTLRDSQILQEIGGDSFKKAVREALYGSLTESAALIEEEIPKVDASIDPIDELLSMAEEEETDKIQGFKKDERNHFIINKDDDSTSKSPMRLASVTWTTPLGLPIVQPYRNYKSKVVKTVIQNISVRDTTSPSEVDSLKQASAFPPNFIHSLDASHMMLSAIACKSEGLHFASVHDSYWCHATDVDKMSRILRDAFVQLHEKDIMAELKAEFEVRFRGYKTPIKYKLDKEEKSRFREYLIQSGRLKEGSNRKIKTDVVIWVDFRIPPIPAKGDFNVESVKASKYFFH